MITVDEGFASAALTPLERVDLAGLGRALRDRGGTISAVRGRASSSVADKSSKLSVSIVQQRRRRKASVARV